MLTLIAGSLPWWQGVGSYLSLVYLAAGALAAWMLASRNPQKTEIHGPFQGKAAR
jgi:hypothetical protein